MRGVKISCILLFAGLSAAPLRAQQVWTFDSGSEGWTVADLPCGRPTNTPISTGPVTWQATGGLAGGFIQAADPSGNCFSFNAPAAALGDQSGVVGGELAFALRSTLNNYIDDSIVIFRGAGRTLIAVIEPQPEAQWTAFRVPIVPASFRVDAQFGPTPTPAELASTFAALTVLRISAEFGSIVAETTGLDEVALIAPATRCGEDYNQDGFLNLDDLNDFITDFYTFPPIPGGRQPAAPTYPSLWLGPGVPCPMAGSAPPPYAFNDYIAHGYRVGFSADGTEHCPESPAQPFPNLDNLNDFITAYYARFIAGDC